MLKFTAQHNGAVCNIDPDRITALEECGSGTMIYFLGGSMRVKENRADVYAMLQRAGLAREGLTNPIDGLIEPAAEPAQANN